MFRGLYNILAFVGSRDRRRHLGLDTREGRPARAGCISLVMPTLGGGGAERVMVNLTHAFLGWGREVDLVVYRAEGFYLTALPVGVNLVDLRVTGMGSAIVKMTRYLHQRRPVAMLAAMESPGLSALIGRSLARVPTRVVVAIHNTLSSVGQSEDWLRARVRLEMARRMYPTADGVVAVSEGVAADAARLLRMDRRRLSVIQNPVVTADLARRAAEPVDHPWFAPGASPVILGCGRLVPQKNFDLLIKAFQRLRQRREARLMILGDGEERGLLEALVHRLGLGSEVALPGFVSNPYAHMAKARVFALSSHYEGSPLVLVEALACGCPVVSTDCPSGPREILRGIEAAELVPVDDVGALAAALERCLDRPSGVARPTAPPEFDGEFAAEAYLRLVEGTAERHPGTEVGAARRLADENRGRDRSAC